EEIVAVAKRCSDHEEQRLEMGRLRKTIVRHQELDRLKSEFVSNVSHELRTPLFAMGAALELLWDGPSDSATSAKLREVVQNNYDRLREMVGNVLDFSRMERGTLRPVFLPVDITELTRRTEKDLRPLFTKNGISVEPLPEGLPSLMAEVDAGQIQQVLVNLLGNAAKFTPPGGKVGIELSEQDGRVRLSVWDTGKGVAPEHQGKIFERFYQVDSSDTREAGGSGIGLAIVDGIVRMHGGHVWMESRLGNGSRFHVELPKHRETTGAEGKT
ncbi:MAG TPA: HAMP domain-containing sensor histidine kinase, partial [Elusimicrobiota bacterium]|nr:HAMP domain-containing sensor histidine kinase [Elusimicrobiota bacterium]